MDTRIIKIIIALSSLAYAVYLFIDGSIGSGIGMVFVTAILGLFLFRSIRLIIAFYHMRKQNFEKANKWLDRVNPNRLWKRQQAYHSFLTGSVQLQMNNLSVAEKAFRQALSTGLKMSHDKAAAKLNLAMIAAAKQKKREAMVLISEAKKLDKRGILRKDIKMVEQAMKKPQKVIRQRR